MLRALQNFENKQELIKAPRRSNNCQIKHACTMLPTILPLQVIKTLLAIPGLGESKARTLLRNFGSIEAVATASEADLSLAIGSSAGRAVAGFLGKPRDETGGFLNYIRKWEIATLNTVHPHAPEMHFMLRNKF